MSLKTTIGLAIAAMVFGWILLLFTNSELAFKILYTIMAGIGRTVWFTMEAVAKLFAGIFKWAFKKR